MNKGEYGQTIRVNVGEDISGATGYTIRLQPKKGAYKDKVATLGTSNIVDGDQTFIANQYLEYTIADGDIDKSGRWRKQGIAKFPTREVIGNYQLFTVLE